MMKLLISLHVFLGAVLLAIPNMTRRELLFAVPVSPDFRQSSAGRRAIAMFRLVVAAAAAAGIGALVLCPIRLVDTLQPPVAAGTIVIAVLAFYWQYRRLSPFAVEIPRKRTAALSTAPDRLPGFVWLGSGPFALLGAAALYLYLNWDRIPERLAVSRGIASPGGWADRTTKGVYGELLFALELCALLLLVGIAGWYGARRSRSRPVILGGIIAVTYVVAGMSDLIALQPVFGIPEWPIILVVVAALIPILVIMAGKMSHLGEPLDPTPQECWKGGVIYYNPSDPVLFVEKRGGLGYTLNFANRWAWILLAGLALVVATGFLLLD